MSGEGERSGLIRVLAADDDPTVALMMGVVLAPPTFSLHCVADGDSAAQALLAGDFDIVLLDVEMPGQSGLQLAAWLRAQRGSDFPILLLTGREDGEFLDACKRLQVAVLGKPIDWKQLAERVRALWSP